MGARKSLTRAEAIEQYVILRLRTEDINRLDFLVNALYDDKSIPIPADSPFSTQDLEGYSEDILLGLVCYVD
jgi:hypothetical protein